MDQFLQHAYYLFHDVPAREEDYQTVTGSTEFPLKFCKHRWVENINVAERILDVFPALKKYVKSAEEKKVTKPKCTSFTTVVNWVKDPLALAKIEVFLSVARQVQPFLKLYQTDKPMVPFLEFDLRNMIMNILTRIMKPQKIPKREDSSAEFIKIKLDSENLLESHKIDVGYAAEKRLKRLTEKKIN